MTAQCPYCQNPAAFGLWEAVEIATYSTTFEDIPASNPPARKMIDKPVVVHAHLSRNPIRDQPHFHVPCKGHS